MIKLISKSTTNVSSIPLVQPFYHLQGSLSSRTLASLHRTDTVDTAHGTMYTNYGGFPYPQVLLLRLFRRFFPKLQRRLVRTVTLPRTTTLIAQGVTTADVKAVPYISFDAIVGRNSKFYMLTEDNLEELGGVEYRGLTALLWIVGGVRRCAYSLFSNC